METIVCKKCKKLFNYIGGEKICPICREELEETFQKVKKYLRENPNTSSNEICEVCDVSIKQIEKWIREERLELASSSNIKIYCEKCNAPIITGKYCFNCRNEMQKQLSSLLPQKSISVATSKQNQKNRMRFLDN